MNALAEQFTRHLRHNRGVRIKIGGTVIPPGWIPHPSTGRKIGHQVRHQAYAKAIAGWKRELFIGTRSWEPNTTLDQMRKMLKLHRLV